MRVITGEAKGRVLKGPPNVSTRPMQDKIKEGLFSALESLGATAGRVLDLYAGTGSIGIEALSRGAEWADFVDHGKLQCDVIRANLETTRLAGRARVHKQPVRLFISQAREPYDLIFLDPPYADDDISEILHMVATSRLVESGTFVALGHWPRFEADQVSAPLVVCRNRCHGDSCFSIYEIDLDSLESHAHGDIPR